MTRARALTEPLPAGSVLAGIALGAIALASAACGPPAPLPCLDAFDHDARLFRPASIVAGLDEEDVRIVGFDGAVPASARVLLGDVEGLADAHGRFELRAPAAVVTDDDTVTLSLELGGDAEDLVLRVRDVDAAIACVPSSERRGTGTVPNDVTLGTCDGRTLAFVPASGDGAVDALPLDEAAWDADSAFFPPIEGVVAAFPWSVAVLPDGRAVVTLQGTGEVALFDPCTGAVIATSPALDIQSMPIRLPLDPPVTLREPRDVDGDGVVEEVVTEMAPRGPEAVVASRDGLLVYVAYTNVLEPAQDGSPPSPMAIGPGLVVAFRVAGTRFLPAGTAVLPGSNPQGLALADDGDLWVSASGPYAYEGGGFVPAGDSYLFRLDGQTLLLESAVPFGRFAPATPAIVGDRVVVGSTLSARVAVIPVDAASLDDGTILELTEQPGVQAMFDAAVLPGGLVGVTWFETDTLHVVDPRGAVLDPWPFSVTGGIALFAVPSEAGAGEPGPFRGLKAVDVDGRGVGAGVLTLSAELVPFDLRRLFGP